MLKICEKGHQFFKSSNCPTCPVCEQENRPQDGFLSLLPAPARRALANSNIHTLDELSKFSEVEILKLHGMGKSSLPKLRKALVDAGLSFK